MAVGIAGYGVYVPRYRIKREEIAKAWGGGGGRGENSVLGKDEDTITMGCEAAINAFENAALPAEALGAIFLGTSSAPNIEHSSLGIISQVLCCGEGVEVADFGATARAGTAAFVSGRDAVASGRISDLLVIASDGRPTAPGSEPEMTAGAGAAAFVLRENGAVAEIEDVYSYSTHFVDKWRTSEDPRLREYEPRFTRQYGYLQHIAAAARGLARKTGVDVGAFDHVILQQSDARMFSAAAKTLGLKAEQMAKGDVLSEVGDLGAASVFISLARVLDQARPGEKILLVSYGSGQSDAIFLSVKEGAPRSQKPTSRSLSAYLASKEYVEYLEYSRWKRSFRTEREPLRLGLPPASPALWRDGADIRGLKGAKCVSCGYVNFPPSIRKICIRCGQTAFTPYRYCRSGKIHAFCISIYVPPPLESPIPVIIADLDDGNRFRALGTEMRVGEVEIDMPVEIVLRNVMTEDGIGVYGNAFRPIRIRTGA